MNTNRTQPNANRYRIFLLIESVKLIETNIFSEFDYISVLSYNLIKQTSIVLLTSVNLNVWYPKNSIRPVEYHCVKSVQIRSFFCSAFSRIRTEYEEIRSKSPYSVRMRENTNQKNSVFGHFSWTVESTFKLDPLDLRTDSETGNLSLWHGAACSCSR